MTTLRLEAAEKALGAAPRRFVLRVGRFAVGPGETVAILGPSGSGKSTALEILGLLAAPGPAAAFVLDGPDGAVDLLALWRRRDAARLARLRGAQFGFVLQSGGLFPFLGLRDNAALSQRLAGREDPAWLDRLLERLGLAGRDAARPAGLSIGERQRVAIARALAHRPAIVIADEPTSALDPGAAAAAVDLLIDCARDQGAAVILSTHNHELARARGLDCVEIEALGEAEPGSWVSRLDRAT